MAVNQCKELKEVLGREYEEFMDLKRRHHQDVVEAFEKPFQETQRKLKAAEDHYAQTKSKKKILRQRYKAQAVHIQKRSEIMIDKENIERELLQVKGKLEDYHKLSPSLLERYKTVRNQLDCQTMLSNIDLD